MALLENWRCITQITVHHIDPQQSNPFSNKFLLDCSFLCRIEREPNEANSSRVEQLRVSSVMQTVTVAVLCMPVDGSLNQINQPHTYHSKMASKIVHCNFFFLFCYGVSFCSYCKIPARLLLPCWPASQATALEWDWRQLRHCFSSQTVLLRDKRLKQK